MPATVEVNYVQEIPVAVKARGPFGSARVTLATRFAKAAADAADRLGIDNLDEYLSQHYWKIEEECDGSAYACAHAKAREIENEYPPSRLQAMVKLVKELEHEIPAEPKGRETVIKL